MFETPGTTNEINASGSGKKNEGEGFVIIEGKKNDNKII